MPKPTLPEFARVANAVYYINTQGEIEALPQDWSRLETHNTGVQTNAVDDTIGFAIAAYRKENVVVIAVRGSDNFQNVLTDAALVAGVDPNIYPPAKEFTLSIQAQLQAFGVQEIYITGHSLGAAVAKMVAVRIDHAIHAVTFECPGSYPWLSGVSRQILKENFETYQVG